MNLLPFVMIIVLVLGMFSLSQFQRNHSLKQEKNAYIAYFKGLREVRNDLVDAAYVNGKKTKPIHTLSSSNSSKPKKNDDIKKRPFFRERKVGWPSGRLNLSSLLEDVKPPLDLKDICIKYLVSLYGHKDFFPKDPKSLLDLIIAKLKTSKDLIPLHELNLDDPIMHEIFYKMLKGTHTYSLKTKTKKAEGYPPFDHFFTFEKSSHPPMNFNSANEVFLEVALGRHLAEELIKEEKEKIKPNALNSPLKIGDLERLLKDKSPNPIAFFHFDSSSAQKNPEMYVDDQTKITVRIE